jgi:UDP-N-acetylglucosamine 4,6-dehydratase/5-epimerase
VPYQQCGSQARGAVLAKDFSGATVVITGGTGSFGSTIVRRLLSRDAGQVRIFSRDEAKQDELRRELGDSRARFYLGDVRDFESVSEVMMEADFVFHAAALKQVPSCEFFPAQAVLTNVNGSRNVIHAAAAAGVQSVVCLSTDKAVYPINAMGMTKALMEKTAQAFVRNNPRSPTTVSIVRYGNVMHSRGSVIPLFVEQIRSGSALTVTDPQMTRFLMSLLDSVALVEYAFENAIPGDIFVKKAPAATVSDLALGVAAVCHATVEIRTIGTRHGEKLYETLLSREEMAKAENHGDYFRVPLDDRTLDYGLYFEQGNDKQKLVQDYTSHNTRRLDVEGVVGMLKALPEFGRALA